MRRSSDETEPAPSELMERLAHLGVELVRWPEQTALRSALARAGVPRLLLVDARGEPTEPARARRGLGSVACRGCAADRQGRAPPGTDGRVCVRRADDRCRSSAPQSRGQCPAQPIGGEDHRSTYWITPARSWDATSSSNCCGPTGTCLVSDRSTMSFSDCDAELQSSTSASTRHVDADS